MQPARPHPVARWMPSLTDVAFLAPFVFLFAHLDGASTLLGDGDTGWHIRAGEWMLDHGRVPRADIFSFTRPGEPWFAWEWLWDLIFGWLHRIAGMQAVLLASVLVLGLTFALLYRLARARCGNALVAAAVTLLAAMASSVHWLARPHLFTMLFLAVFCTAVEAARNGRPRVLLALPFLTALWTNLHGGFLAGLLLLAGYVAGDLLAAAALPRVRSRSLARAKAGALAAAACLLASFANPYGYRLHLHLAAYLGETFQFQNIAEFFSISFHHPAARFFEVLLIAGIAAAFWHLSRGRVAWAVLLCGWAHLALFSVRNIPLYGIVAAPLASAALVEMARALAAAPVAGWLRSLLAAARRLAADINAIDRLPRRHAASFAGAALLAALLYAPSPAARFRAAYDPARYPAAAIGALDGAARIFTDDEWGDFLIYALYPRAKVFFDGRSDFYGAAFERHCLDVLNVKHGWQAHLDRFAVDTVLLPAGAPLAGALRESRRWRAAYDDGIAIVFRRAPGDAGQAPSIAGRRPAAPATTFNPGSHGPAT